MAQLLSARAAIPATYALVAVTAALAGAGLVLEPRALAVLPILFLLVFPTVRAGQIALTVVLLQGATIPVGEVAGMNPVYLAVWGVVGLLCVTDTTPRRAIGTAVAISLVTYGAGICLSGALHENALGLGRALSLVNYLGVFLLTAMLVRRHVGLLVAPLVVALGVHEVIAVSELMQNATWFYADWKPFEATKVAGITRVASTVADPNYFAVTLILLAAGILTVTRHVGQSRLAQALALGAGILLPFTFSRAAAIAVLVAVLVGVLRTRLATSSKLALRGAAFAVAVLCMAIVFMPDAPRALVDRYSPTQQADASIESRSAIQRNGLEDALEHPVAGLGPGAFERSTKALYDPAKPNNLQTDVLNTYLQAALAGGILVLIAFLVIYAVSTWRMIRAAAPLGFALAGVAAALLTLDGLGLAPLWFALGAGSAIDVRRRYDEGSGKPERR